MLSFLGVRRCVSGRFYLSNSTLKSFKNGCGLKHWKKWQVVANEYFVFINNRLSLVFWWEAVKHKECASVFSGSRRGCVWPLSAVISAALQWVALTAELAWMLSHVLVRPLRVRRRTSLLSASITSLHTNTHAHCPDSPDHAQYSMCFTCTQRILRLFYLVTCQWR